MVAVSRARCRYCHRAPTGVCACCCPEHDTAYRSLPRRDSYTGERPLYLDIEEANRRDAVDDELLSPPSSVTWPVS